MPRRDALDRGVRRAVIDNHDRVGVTNRGECSGEVVGPIAHGNDDGDVATAEDRLSGPRMHHAGVEQPARQALRAFRPRHGLAGHQSIHEPRSGCGETEQSQRRPTYEHRSLVDPAHPRIERDPPVPRQHHRQARRLMRAVAATRLGLSERGERTKRANE